jgi:hypothetical protein
MMLDKREGEDKGMQKEKTTNQTKREKQGRKILEHHPFEDKVGCELKVCAQAFLKDWAFT